MSGCFGNSADDRYFEGKLNAHLSTCDHDEEAIEYIEQREFASWVEGELFHREGDHTEFEVVIWPELEQDYDVDEETGRAYPCGATWSGYKIRELGVNEPSEETEQ